MNSARVVQKSRCFDGRSADDHIAHAAIDIALDRIEALLLVADHDAAARVVRCRGAHAGDQIAHELLAIRIGLVGERDHNGVLDDAGVAAEPPLPQTIGENRDSRRARLVLFGQEIPAHGGIDAEHGKESGVHMENVDALRIIAGQQGRRRRCVRGHGFE